MTDSDNPKNQYAREAQVVVWHPWRMRPSSGLSALANLFILRERLGEAV